MSTIQNKRKPCKGTTSETRGFGCGTLSYKRTFGLGNCCLRKWAQETDSGMKWLLKQTAYKIKKERKAEKRELTEQKKALDNKGAMRLADMYFSRYLRLYYSRDGFCTCFTCSKIVPIKEIDNGHYQKREHKGTRYEHNNCRPQCKTCNGDTKHNGKQDIFRVNLVFEVGEEEVIRIETLAATIVKANNLFFRETADLYRNKLNERQKLMKVKYW